MRDNLEEMLDGLDSDADRFYEKTIPLHSDPRLRSLVRQHRIITVVPPDPHGADRPQLYYDSQGFKASMPYWHDGPWGEGWNNYEHCLFREEGGRLMCEVEKGSYKGRREMLEIFPELTASDIYSRFESEIEEYMAKRR